jgi:Na+-driven multidrug efflux pump
MASDTAVLEAVDDLPPIPEPKAPRYDRSIVDGSLSRAVWKIAWPTMLTNAIGGLQGMVDHALVGNLIGARANAAIGVSIQLWIVVIVFISSIFIGMSVMVARFAVPVRKKSKPDGVSGVSDCDLLSFGILAPVGYFAAPYLLNLVKRSRRSSTEALPFLRSCMHSAAACWSFSCWRSAAFGGRRANADDPRHRNDVLNLVLNIILIRGLGPVRHSAQWDLRWEHASRRVRYRCMRYGSCGEGVGGFVPSAAEATHPTGAL